MELTLKQICSMYSTDKNCLHCYVDEVYEDLFKEFIHKSKDKNDWIWDKIVPEGQIFYTKKIRYKKGITLKGINFVLKCWYLNDDYQELVLEERLLLGVK